MLFKKPYNSSYFFFCVIQNKKKKCFQSHNFQKIRIFYKKRKFKLHKKIEI